VVSDTQLSKVGKGRCSRLTLEPQVNYLDGSCGVVFAGCAKAVPSICESSKM